MQTKNNVSDLLFIKPSFFLNIGKPITLLASSDACKNHVCMADLIAMQPHINIPLYIVAPDERREKVYAEVNRPVFSSLSTPMNQICKYIPFSGLRSTIKNTASMTKYLKPEFLDEIAEDCEVDQNE